MKKYVANEGYNNQKYVTINKGICDSEHIYTKIQNDALTSAMKNLSNKTLQLYLYLSMNQDRYGFWLSKSDVLEKTGIKSETTYLSAVKELIEKGYLVQEGGDGNKFMFYEVIDGKIADSENDTSVIQSGTEEQHPVSSESNNNRYDAERIVNDEEFMKELFGFDD